MENGNGNGDGMGSITGWSTGFSFPRWDWAGVSWENYHAVVRSARIFFGTEKLIILIYNAFLFMLEHCCCFFRLDRVVLTVMVML